MPGQFNCNDKKNLRNPTDNKRALNGLASFAAQLASYRYIVPATEARAQLSRLTSTSITTTGECFRLILSTSETSHNITPKEQHAFTLTPQENLCFKATPRQEGDKTRTLIAALLDDLATKTQIPAARHDPDLYILFDAQFTVWTAYTANNGARYVTQPQFRNAMQLTTATPTTPRSAGQKVSGSEDESKDENEDTRLETASLLAATSSSRSVKLSNPISTPLNVSSRWIAITELDLQNFNSSQLFKLLMDELTQTERNEQPTPLCQKLCHCLFQPQRRNSLVYHRMDHLHLLDQAWNAESAIHLSPALFLNREERSPLIPQLSLLSLTAEESFHAFARQLSASARQCLHQAERTPPQTPPMTPPPLYRVGSKESVRHFLRLPLEKQLHYLTFPYRLIEVLALLRAAITTQDVETIELAENIYRLQNANKQLLLRHHLPAALESIHQKLTDDDPVTTTLQILLFDQDCPTTDRQKALKEQFLLATGGLPRRQDNYNIMVVQTALDLIDTNKNVTAFLTKEIQRILILGLPDDALESLKSTAAAIQKRTTRAQHRTSECTLLKDIRQAAPRCSQHKTTARS